MGQRISRANVKNAVRDLAMREAWARAAWSRLLVVEGGELMIGLVGKAFIDGEGDSLDMGDESSGSEEGRSSESLARRILAMEA